MRKILAAFAALTLGLSGVLALTVPASATPPGNETKTGLCHRTASDTNPYVFIEVDDESLQAHLSNNEKGHFEKYWKSDGVFRGVAHVKGDPKNDYKAEVASDCEDNTPVQPEPLVVTDTDTRMSCDAGVEEQVTKTTTSYIWNGKEWVLDKENAVVEVGDWTFVRDLTEAERVELDCVDQPPPLVTTSDWVDGQYECDDTTVEQTRTVTTTPYVLDGENGYVLDEANATTVTETQTRDLTAEEQTACPTDDPKDPEEPNTPQNKPPTELPGTGASDVLPWAGLGLVVLLTGLLTHMVITRRSKNLI